MIKKIIASALAIQLLLPISALAQINPKQSPSTLDVELLLEKPKKVFSKDAKELGVSSLSLAGLSAFVYVNGKQMAKTTYMTKFPLDALTETVQGMMRILRNDGGKFVKMNPSIERHIFKAFSELRGMQTHPFHFIFGTKADQKILPSYIRNQFVFELDKIKFPKGNPKHTSQFKQLIRDVNKITGRKKSRAGVVGVSMLALGGLTAWALSIGGEEKINHISNSRALVSEQLNEVKKSNPDFFALSIIDLPAEQRRLVASVIAESANEKDGGFYNLVKTQIDGMTAQETVSNLKNLLTSEEAFGDESTAKTDELKDALSSLKTEGVSLNASFI